jgi:hypothetical protein
MNKYAGIGSRQTPKHILNIMTSIASKLEANGFMLRSGGAIGADTAFENGIQFNSNKEIFLADDATTDALQLAEMYHPNWDACSAYARKLHARNGMILLGANLNDPVNFVICYTADGKATGGTGQALRLADDKNIPILNLYFDDVYQRAINFLGINNIDRLEIF